MYLHCHESFGGESRYRGLVKPENLIFNANLQEFAQKVDFIAGLVMNSKLSPVDGFTQIEFLWEQLALSKEQLKIGELPSREDEG